MWLLELVTEPKRVMNGNGQKDIQQKIGPMKINVWMCDAEVKRWSRPCSRGRRAESGSWRGVLSLSVRTMSDLILKTNPVGKRKPAKNIQFFVFLSFLREMQSLFEISIDPQPHHHLDFCTSFFWRLVANLTEQCHFHKPSLINFNWISINVWSALRMN